MNGPPIDADAESTPFFDAAAKDTLLAKWCSNCSNWAAPTADSCPHCQRHALQWREAAGTGQLVTWTVQHSLPHPEFADDMPIVSAIVELSEGPWMTVRLVGPTGRLIVGAAVQIRFAQSDGGASYPVGVVLERNVATL